MYAQTNGSSSSNSINNGFNNGSQSSSQYGQPQTAPPVAPPPPPFNAGKAPQQSLFYNCELKIPLTINDLLFQLALLQTVP